MASQQKHLIKSANLRVEFQGREEAMKERAKLTGFFNLKILPQLEKAFDKFSSPDKLITINRLKIDLGKFSMSKEEPDFESQISSLTLQKLNSLDSADIKSKIIQKAILDSYFLFLETGYFDLFIP